MLGEKIVGSHAESKISDFNLSKDPLSEITARQYVHLTAHVTLTY